ncbi:MAG TPA: PKD domain-containing protein [Planctomycetota bacterium]|jgi:hypothetical protein
MLYRQLVPSADPPRAGLRDEQSTIWLAQFGGPLTSAEIAKLSARGVQVLMPTVGCAFHVRASHAALRKVQGQFAPNLLGWCRLEPADRLLPAILRNTCPQYSVSPNGPFRRLELYPGADAQAVARQAQALGCRIERLDPLSPIAGVTRGLEVSGPPGRALSEQLASIEDVYVVDWPRPPKKACNREAASASGITLLQAAPHNLSGSGINVMVRDVSAIFAHPDFGTRLTLGPDVVSAATSQHSTHVAGTIGGSGLADPMAAACGMAPACNLISFDMNGDDVAEPLAAKTDYSAFLSNHSYSFVTGWDNGTFTDNQSTFGQYGTFAKNWDALIRTENLLMVKAVGNDRNDSGPGHPHDGTLAGDGQYYGTTDSSSTSKNVLTVGASIDGVQPGAVFTAVSVLDGSSSGPCQDGRLRPEIVANGDTVDSTNNDATPGSQYVVLSGTSQACAVVTGATALLLERYKQRYTSTLNPVMHYVRALYAQTATDIGRAGPDYLHGFGLLDLGSAIGLFETDASGHPRLMTSYVDATTPERFFLLNSDGVTTLKATLCWTDDAGDVLASRAIVNDLDLKLIRVIDQAVSYPFKLDPTAPDRPATRAVNDVDTIEQLVLETPVPGNYLLSVRGTTLASQTFFTLASSHDLVEVLPPVAVISSSATTGPPPFSVAFDGSGSSDPGGSSLSYTWAFGDGQTADGVQTQHTYYAGGFKAVLKVINNQGASATASVFVSVDNKPPVAVATASPDSGLAPLTTTLSSFGSYDKDNNLATWIWDCGDGQSNSGPVVQHMYASPGLYFATLTVGDVVNATASRTIPILAGQKLTLANARFKLNFKRFGLDSFTFTSKTVPIASNLTTSGLIGTVQIGTNRFDFLLDNKGRFVSPQLRLQLNPARTQLTVTLRNVNLANDLANYGAANMDLLPVYLVLPMAVYLGDSMVVGATGVPFSYSATRGRAGNGKLILQR